MTQNQRHNQKQKKVHNNKAEKKINEPSKKKETETIQEPKKNNKKKTSKPKQKKQTEVVQKAPEIAVKTRVKKNAGSKTSKKSAPKLKVIPIGGLHEIGKNMTLLEYENDIIIIDCGMTFPGDEMLGIDVVIPDFSYLVENADRVRGLVVTHAHEDHIGGIPYLLQKLNIPVYASKLTIGFIKRKLDERKFKKAKLHEIEARKKTKIGVFTVEPIHTTHSVPDCFALAIDTPVGKVIHTGDFKVDYTPVDGKPIDLARFGELGSEGVHLLLAESTNAHKKGYTPSEKVVGDSLEHILTGIKGRIILATFSSNVHRVQKVIDIAAAEGRKVAFSGRSMEQMVTIASDLGYLHIPSNTMISLKEISKYPDDELCIITTGSQGEPMSALYRMASGEHRDVHVRPGDTIILSSSPVPGNEKAVANIVNALFDLGAQVIYSELALVHVSGHACSEELKLIHSLVKPKFFIPVHGEAKHLRAHEDIALEMGMDPSHILMVDNGNIVEVSHEKMRLSSDKVPAEAVLVDGLGVGDVGAVVLNERRSLSEAGCMMIGVALDAATLDVICPPSISTRGLIYVREYGNLIKDAEMYIGEVIEQATPKQKRDEIALKKYIRDKMFRFIYQRTERSPVIVSVIMYV